jgi:hypothetical protein
MKISREYNFNDLYKNSWAGAIDTLNIIIYNNKEDELMELLEKMFFEQIPTETEVNDYLWFSDYIFECLGIDVED